MGIPKEALEIFYRKDVTPTQPSTLLTQLRKPCRLIANQTVDVISAAMVFDTPVRAIRVREMHKVPQFHLPVMQIVRQYHLVRMTKPISTQRFLPLCTNLVFLRSRQPRFKTKRSSLSVKAPAPPWFSHQNAQTHRPPDQCVQFSYAEMH